VRVLVEGIDNENNSIRRAFDDSARDLNVSTHRPRFHALHVETNFLDQQSTSGTRSEQLASLQSIPIESGKSDQVGLLAIMRDDRQTRPVDTIISSEFHR
jgi:hypothetical protein